MRAATATMAAIVVLFVSGGFVVRYNVTRRSVSSDGGRKFSCCDTHYNAIFDLSDTIRPLYAVSFLFLSLL